MFTKIIFNYPPISISLIYFHLDPTCRAPNPPTALFNRMCTNLAEIVWEGSDGTLVDPVFSAKYGAIIILSSDYARNHFYTMDVPKDFADDVFYSYPCKIDGRIYVVPQRDDLEMNAACQVVAIGDDLDKVIAEVKDRASKIEGHQIRYDESALDSALTDFKKSF